MDTCPDFQRETSVVASLTLLHSEQPKLYGVLAVLSAIGLKSKILEEFCCPGKQTVWFKRIYFDFLHVSHITICKFLGLERKQTVSQLMDGGLKACSLVCHISMMKG